MRKSHNRSVIAERAALANRPGATPSTVGTNVAARPSTVVQHCEGPVRRSRALKLTATQKNSDTGKSSEWNDSVSFFTCPKWDQTVQSQRI